MSTNAISSSKLLSLAQAAELLGLSTRTIRRRIANGQLPAYRSGRKVIRIKTTDLDRIFRRIPSARG
jgi:excisionase family DNA binding protein